MSRLNGHANPPVRDVAATARRMEAENKLRLATIQREQIDRIEAAVGGLGGLVAHSGSYENAKRSRLRAGNRAPGGSVDGHRDRNSIGGLRRDAQALRRNNPAARSMVQRLIDAVVSDGFTFQAETESKDWNTRAEDLVGEWIEGDECDSRGMMSLHGMAAAAVDAACTDGDCLALETTGGSLQWIEGERIKNPGGNPVDTATMVGGVELAGRGGRPVAYHLAEWDGMTSSYAAQATERRRAETVLFLANPLGQLIGATRGEPQLAAVVKRFEDLDGWDESTRVHARIRAAYTGFITTPRPDLTQSSMPGLTLSREPTEDDDGEERELRLEPGMFHHLPIGSDVKFSDLGQPGASHEVYTQTQLMIIGAELGLPLFWTTLDGRQVNLATMRALTQICWRHFLRWQDWLTRKLYRPAYLWKVARLIREGELEFREDWKKHSWNPPPPPVMDSVTEVKAARESIDGRLKSRKRVMREVYGIDQATEDEQIGRERESMRAAGIEEVNAPGTAGGKSFTAENAESAETGPTIDDADDADGTETTEPAAPEPVKAAAPKPKPPKDGEGAGFLIGDKTLASDLVGDVAAKRKPAESAKKILTTMLGMDEQQATEIIAPAEAFKAPAPAAPEGTPA